MQIIQLHPKHDYCDLAKCLRNIADDLEAGNYENQPTMGVLVLATEKTRNSPDGRQTAIGWQVHGLGESVGQFMARGILASALQSFEGPV